MILYLTKAVLPEIVSGFTLFLTNPASFNFLLIILNLHPFSSISNSSGPVKSNFLFLSQSLIFAFSISVVMFSKLFPSRSITIISCEIFSSLK